MDANADRARILVVDDTLDTVEVIKRNLEAEGHQVHTAASVAGAMELLGRTPVDLVITDNKMPGASGMDLVRHVGQNFKYTAVMMITGFPSFGGAVQAVKDGAESYLIKPFTDDELRGAVREALHALRRKQAADTGPRHAHSACGMLGDSAVMRKVLEDIAKATATTATLLITGESGTGKELVARESHYNSNRASAPFVPVNCGGIPDQLLESELFGYLKGAFTGAEETRAGFFQTADGGTIFLDEISNTSLSMQAKLLRVLEDKQVGMVGARRTEKVDVRVIAATNRDLAGLVRHGSFREDLFYRLNVITIDLPPLRKRGHDILILARHFAREFTRELDRPAPRFTDNALKALLDHHWPGNVRELQNVVQRLVVMIGADTIDVPDLPPAMRFALPREQGLDRTLAEVEAAYIAQVLKSVADNKTRAAKILGIDRKTLRAKLKEPPESETP